jgi:hypothetical protein
MANYLYIGNKKKEDCVPVKFSTNELKRGTGCERVKSDVIELRILLRSFFSRRKFTIEVL